jgi:hypothetical protein
MGKFFSIGILRNHLQPAVRCCPRICMEGFKRTVINIRILASGPRIKSETCEIQIRIVLSKF